LGVAVLAHAALSIADQLDRVVAARATGNGVRRGASET
jgi:hypothetical protein